eukprot:533772-Pelagomonas_calceolata.AAC.3
MSLGRCGGETMTQGHKWHCWKMKMRSLYDTEHARKPTAEQAQVANKTSSQLKPSPSAAVGPAQAPMFTGCPTMQAHARTHIHWLIHNAKPMYAPTYTGCDPQYKLTVRFHTYWLTRSVHPCT